MFLLTQELFLSSLSLSTSTENRSCEDIAWKWPSESQERIQHKSFYASTLNLDFWAPHLWENKFLLLKPPSLWYCVMVILAVWHGIFRGAQFFFFFNFWNRPMIIWTNSQWVWLWTWWCIDFGVSKNICILKRFLSHFNFMLNYVRYTSNYNNKSDILEKLWQ